MTTFAEQFEALGDAPIHYEGRELRPSLVVPVSGADLLDVRFLVSADRPIQGLGIKCEQCEISVAGTTAKQIGLWIDTAPREVRLQVRKAKPGAHIRFFNQWRDEKYGTTMYRLNNAAMEIIPQANGAFLARCSDGWGAPDFNDLVFELIVHRGGDE